MILEDRILNSGTRNNDYALLDLGQTVALFFMIQWLSELPKYDLFWEMVINFFFLTRDM